MSYVNPVISPAVPVQSPNIPTYPPVQDVILQSQAQIVTGNDTITTSGSVDQPIISIPLSVLGDAFFTSSKAVLNIETGQDISGSMINFAYQVLSDLSGAAPIGSRDFTTTLDPTYFSAPTTLYLSRENNYPVGTSNLTVYFSAPNVGMFAMPTSNAVGVSYCLSSLG